jgi:putative ABC transport system permease protein
VFATKPALLLFTVIVGIISGSYPAFFLSSFTPYTVLKGKARNSTSNGRLRRILVVFQFAVSILLIVGTLIMNKQIKYMLNKDVGFNKEQLIVIERAQIVGNKMPSFKESVKMIPGVINMASSTAIPGRTNNNNGYLIEGRKDETYLMTTSWVDYDFLDTYGMKLESGRVFNESFTNDKQACILNESAVKNFNFESLRNPIQPYILLLVSISAIIAWPIIYYYAGKWLENFYYKINLGFFSFIGGLTIALSIALIAISYRVIKAARINPAQSLKYE